jgi:hypothetical protein
MKMPLVNKIKEMQDQGLADEQIAQQLGEQGFSPLEVSQALEQAKIKAAVSEPQPQTPTALAGTPAQTLQPPETEGMEMQQSVMESQPLGEAPVTIPEPQAPLSEAPVTEASPETPNYIYPTPQAPYSGYQPYEYQPASAETMSEIAEQISEEKSAIMKKNLSSLENFKVVAERKIKDIDERLKKIEQVIERLQASIIGKIGSYWQNIQDIKKEMQMMQESFSKALNPLIEKGGAQSKPAVKRATEKPKNKKRKSSGIEHYLKR